MEGGHVTRERWRGIGRPPATHAQFFERHLEGVRRRLAWAEKARLDRQMATCIEPAVITRGVGFGGVSAFGDSALAASGREFDVS